MLFGKTLACEKYGVRNVMEHSELLKQKVGKIVCSCKVNEAWHFF
jgi:hypothetical protein